MALKLVTLDLDGTLIRTTVFEAAARELGFGDAVVHYDGLYERALLSLEATFFVEYDLFLGIEVARIHEALARGPWVEGIAETISALRARGLEVWVVTDQPSWAVAFLDRFGIRESVCSAAIVRDGVVGACPEPRFEKWPALQQRLAERGIPPEDVCHVGNGVNDLPIWKHVGRGIAFNGSAAVEKEASAVVRGNDLRAVLAQLA